MPPAAQRPPGKHDRRDFTWDCNLQVFAMGKVEYVYQPLGIVVAETPALAAQGAALVAVEYVHTAVRLLVSLHKLPTSMLAVGIVVIVKVAETPALAAQGAALVAIEYVPTAVRLSVILSADDKLLRACEPWEERCAGGLPISTAS